MKRHRNRRLKNQRSLNSEEKRKAFKQFRERDARKPKEKEYRWNISSPVR